VNVSEYNYELPVNAIAQRPVEPRDLSRMFVVDRANCRREHRRTHDLPEYLHSGDALVINEARVIPARLHGVRETTGGKVEVFLLHPNDDGGWDVLVRPGRKAPPGETILFPPTNLRCEVGDRTPQGGRRVRFEGDLEGSLDRIGETPLPPYIRRSPEPEDASRYQTVYARIPGSVTAPTAGLHMTEELLERIRRCGVSIVRTVLHVGLGTFRPISVSDVRDHSMDAERYQLSEETADMLNETRARGGRIVAVGTTAVRVLESCAAEDGRLSPSSGWTDIFIYPPYRFRAVDVLLTNFHLPRSTLLLLVAAFADRETILNAYADAIKLGYRFFSYGDAMLIQ
jgi:S-adenosylmethionine:tRNA ribosyltransferase-isomerase